MQSAGQLIVRARPRLTPVFFSSKVFFFLVSVSLISDLFGSLAIVDVDQASVPQAFAQVSPGQEQGRQGGGEEVPGAWPGLRGVCVCVCVCVCVYVRVTVGRQTRVSAVGQAGMPLDDGWMRMR